MDLVFVGAIVALAGLTALLVGLCDRLMHSRRDQP
jgi:hypothetical protein